jgi:hypothetical protein
MDKLPKKSLDVQQILDKIKNLQIDNEDKATILEEIKKNIMNPSAGENQNLNDIQSKYTTMNMPQGYQGYQGYQGSPNLMPINSYQNQPNFQQIHQKFDPQQINNHQINNHQKHNQFQPTNYDNSQQSQVMTVMHFDILKNKIDSLQYELIDLLRHVKDYTQRYMNAVRQQDLDKINEYINGLFEVDKTLKETQELAESAPAEGEEGEEGGEGEPQDRKSLIGKATSGIKNFFGNIGNNVAGITDLVKNTADIANGYLTKKVIPSSTSNASNVSVSSNTNSNTINRNSNTTGNTIVSRNKNIVSVDDYISDMNKMESMNNISTSNIKSNITVSPNIVSSNSNNINSLGINKNVNISNKVPNEEIPNEEIPNEVVSNEVPNEEIPNEVESNNTENDLKDPGKDLEGALKQLNDKMNEDIEKTVNTNIQSGGKRTKTYIVNKKENNLTQKIRLLKLKLTKNKLQKQLKDNNNNNNNNYNNKTKNKTKTNIKIKKNKYEK